MGTRGPIRTPTIIQLKRGNASKRVKSTFDREMKPPWKNLSCPTFLSPAAQAEWRRVLASIGEMETEGQRLLTDLDRAVLSVYCQTFADWQEAVSEIETNGSVIEIRAANGDIRCAMPSPWVGIRNKSAAALKGFMLQLGFSPASRLRLPTVLPVGEDIAGFAKKAGFDVK